MNTAPAHAALLAACVLASTSLHAQQPAQDLRPYVSGFYTHVFEQDDRDQLVGGATDVLKAGQGFQLGGGMAINQYFGWELSAFANRFKKDDDNGGANSLREYGGKLDGLFFYSRDPEKLMPYFGLGVGGIHTKLRGTGESSTDPFAEAGLGVIKYFRVGGADLGLRAEARYRYVVFDEDALGGSDQDNIGEPVLRVGVVMPFGKRPQPVPAAAAACADADGDGVCDGADLCPETPRGTAVDAKGCPTGAGGEGADRRFEDVYFAFDRAELTDFSKAMLDNAASVIQKLGEAHPGLKVEVHGHTDWIGTDAYNQGLSERRANVVRDYLQRKGVDGARISTQAYGETRPKATNDTDEGRALNRRAEVHTRGK